MIRQRFRILCWQQLWDHNKRRRLVCCFVRSPNHPSEAEGRFQHRQDEAKSAELMLTMCFFHNTGLFLNVTGLARGRSKRVFWQHKYQVKSLQDGMWRECGQISSRGGTVWKSSTCWARYSHLFTRRSQIIAATYRHQRQLPTVWFLDSWQKRRDRFLLGE